MVQQIIYFIIDALIGTAVLYIFTNQYLRLENSSLLKAVIITFSLNIAYLLISLLLNNPESYQSAVIGSVAKYLFIIPKLIVVYFAYSFTLKQLLYFLIFTYVAGYITHPVTIVIYKLIGLY